MNNQHINEKFSELSTPLIADACPAGPQRPDPRDADALKTAHFGNLELTN